MPGPLLLITERQTTSVRQRTPCSSCVVLPSGKTGERINAAHNAHHRRADRLRGIGTSARRRCRLDPLGNREPERSASRCTSGEAFGPIARYRLVLPWLSGGWPRQVNPVGERVATLHRALRVRRRSAVPRTLQVAQVQRLRSVRSRLGCPRRRW